MSQSKTPHYKTLDIIEFYNQIYDFVSRYLIFVLAWFFAVITILIIWIWEPMLAPVTNYLASSWYVTKWYILGSWLIYPINYFAEWSLNLEGDSKILWLGWPIWNKDKMWNSIDNIVQYNGVILPRQISRSAWVPKLQQAYYSEDMIKTFLKWMGTSQADINTIKFAMDTITKQWLSGDSIIDHFGIGCSVRPLRITKFCDLKLIDTISQWYLYDLSQSATELKLVHDYLFINHINEDIQKLWCKAMIQQYRYSGNTNLINLTQWCSKQITDEVQYISNMISVNQEVKSNAFTKTIYSEPSINRYKLMSLYQYLIQKINIDQFTDEDIIILTNYNSYIIKLVNKGSIVQPYWDIISIFHQQYLIPWLNGRDSFAKSDEKDLTQTLIKTTNLIIYGDSTQWITSINSWSKIKPVDFLKSQWLYYGTGDAIVSNSGSIIASNTVQWNIPDEWNSTGLVDSPVTQTTGSNTSIIPKQDTTNDSSLNTLIAQVLRTIPTTTPIKKWQLILIKYNYKWASWFTAIDLSKNGDTQIYYDSPISGATKITHPKVIFNTTNKELILAIMDNYLATNPQ